MALSTNTAPYYDDYNRDKQYYRILFRPGHAVQARELTQLQTMLQKQIERHGTHVFNHGARVIDGDVAYNKCDHIKLADRDDNTPNGTLIDVSKAYSSTTLTGILVGLDATAAGNYVVEPDGSISTPDGRKPVAEVVLATERSNNGDPATLLINYESGDQFAANDYITKIGNPSDFPDTFQAVVNSTVTSSAKPTGRASYASMEGGVFYVTTSTGGYFAYTPKQKIVLEKYSDSPTYKVGLKIAESFVTEIDDNTLYDNAQGTNANFAPGAHRLKVALDLSVAPNSDGSTIDPSAAADFVELLRIEDGQRAYGSEDQISIYSVLGDALAERTYDESGNYIVDDFDCRVEDGPNGNIKVSVQPVAGKTMAKAYIRGHQYEQSHPWIEYIDKARKTATLNGLTIPLDQGAYLYVENLQAQGEGAANWINPGRLPVWDIHTCNSAQVDTSDADSYNSTLAGRFRLRDVVPVGANTHAIYVTDFEGSPALTGNFADSPVTTGIDGNGATQVRIQTANTASVNNAYIGSKITITYSQNHAEFAGQTRTVIQSQYDPAATEHYLWVDRPFAQPTANIAHFPGKQEKYVLNADLAAAATGNGCIIGTLIDDFTRDINEAQNGIPPANKNANGEISRVATSTNTSAISAGTFTPLIFKLPVGGARIANSIGFSTTGTHFTSFQKYSESVAASSGTATFNVSGFRNGSYSSEAEFAVVDKEAYTVINETTGRSLSSDDWTLSGSITTFVITSPFITGSNRVRLIGPVKVTNINSKKKTLLRGVNTTQVAYPITTDRTPSGNSHVVFATPNKKPGGKDNLGLVDVFRVVDVYDTGDPSVAPTGDMINNSVYRVTNNYSLDSGQTEEYYDYASIILNSGARPPVGQLLVVVDRFLHTTTSPDSGVFTVDSYHGEVALDEIPKFISSKTGIKYDLREYVDFRPARMVETTSSGAANTSYFVPFGVDPNDNNGHTSGFEMVQPDPLGAFQFDMQYFAPRFDRVVLSVRQTATGSNTGFLKIVSGSDDRSPAIPPAVDEEDLTLFTLGIPSYTPKASDISVVRENNRRFTMKDISNINSRIDRLEYFSTLSLLEQDIADLKVFDSTGQIERFKHGFIVDTFETGTALADVGSPATGPNLDFQASIGKGVLRPAVEQENVLLNYDSTRSSKVSVSGGVLHLPYTAVTSDSKLQQTRATEDGAQNINPYQIQSFQGTLSLSPSSDQWKSVLDAPERRLDSSGQYDAARAMVKTLNDRMGPAMYMWGEWEDEWYGDIKAGEAEYVANDPSGAIATIKNWRPKSKTARGSKLDVGFGSNLYGHYSNKSSYTKTINGVRVKFNGQKNLKYWRNTGNIVPGDPRRVGVSPRQITIYDDEVSRTTFTQDIHQVRIGSRTQFRIQTDKTVVGEMVVGTNLAQYMRPIDINFRAHGLKPETVMYPHFDEVDIRPYTERANELVLRNTSGFNDYSNPFGFSQNEEEILSAVTGTGDGICIGFNPNSNTHYIVSANGTFNVDDTVTGSIIGTPGDGGRTVVSYKHYSGSVYGATSSTLILDDAASNSLSWYSTSSSSRAKDSAGGGFDVDLYGKTIYITEGRGYGQARTITAYSNATNTLTVDKNWTLTPNTQSRYSIGEHKTNRAGSLYGVFHVPNYTWANRIVRKRQEGDPGASATTGAWIADHVNSDEYTLDRQRFLTGNKSFQVRDTLNKLSTDLHSFAIGSFKSTGTIEIRRKSVADVYGVETVVKDVSDSRIQTRRTVQNDPTGRRIEVGNICWMDPLAQTILVDSQAYPEGIYIDSVDIWFKKKPDTGSLNSGSGLPVTLQIRPTVAGHPSGGEVIASSVRHPAEINISTGTLADLPSTANTATLTNFKFNHPIYLAGGNEYAIVLITDAKDYEVWTTRVGSTEVGTGGTTGLPEVIVDGQPHLGALFKSQNGSTWTPSMNQDLMFRVRKCVFESSDVGTAIFKTANAMSQYVPSFTRVHNALAHTNWSGGTKPELSDYSSNPYSFKVWEDDFDYHRFRINATKNVFPSGSVFFEYASAVEGEATAPDLSTLDLVSGYTPIEVNEDMVPDNTLRILKDQTGSFVLKTTLSTSNPCISPMINLERLSITMIRNLINDGQLYANTWPSEYILTDDYASGNVVGGGFYIESSGTGYTDGEAITAITTSEGNFGVGASGSLIANGTGSIVGITLTNVGNTYLQSPTIDISGAAGSGGSIKYIGEDEPQGPGNFTARYMTRKVPLSDIAEAKDIKVWLTAAQPEETIIWVYTKVRNKSDIESFEDKKWVLMKRMQTFADEVSSSEDDFREISFMGGGESDNEFPLAYDSKVDGVEFSGSNQPSGERYNTFNEFAIKIVMQTNDPRIVPVIRDLRAVALE